MIGGATGRAGRELDRAGDADADAAHVVARCGRPPRAARRTSPRATSRTTSGPSAIVDVGRASRRATSPARSVTATRECVAPRSAASTTPASRLKANVCRRAAAGRGARAGRDHEPVREQRVHALGDGRARQAGAARRDPRACSRARRGSAAASRRPPSPRTSRYRPVPPWRISMAQAGGLRGDFALRLREFAVGVCSFCLTIGKSRGSVRAHGERAAAGGRGGAGRCERRRAAARASRRARASLRGTGGGGRGGRRPLAVGDADVGPRRRRAAATGAHGLRAGSLAAPPAAAVAGARGDRFRRSGSRGVRASSTTPPARCGWSGSPPGRRDEVEVACFRAPLEYADHELPAELQSADADAARRRQAGRERALHATDGVLLARALPPRGRPARTRGRGLL